MYQALHDDKKHVMSHAHESGKVSRKRNANQKVIAQAIFNQVGEDTPIHITKHILVAYRKLNASTSWRNKSTSFFADRFLRLAEE